MKLWPFTRESAEEKRQKQIINKLESIMATQAELAEQIRQSTVQTRKGIDEVLGKIKALEDVIAAGGSVSPELEAAVAELKTASQALDDIVPDAPPA
jgi:seryl-tRNA synthetase